MKNCFFHYHPELVKKFAKGNTSGAITGNVFVPLIITLIFYNIIPNTELFIWLALHILIFLSRIALKNKISKYLYIYTSLIALSSMLYAIFAWMSLIYGEGTHLLFAGMIIASVAAASMISLVSVFHMYSSFVSIQIIGLISAFLYYGQDLFYLSALLAVAFLFFILLNGYNQFTTLKEEIKLKEQVHDLLDNSGQGFLSFNEDMKCDRAFSLECKKIFNLDDIEGMDISELLFNNKEDKELFLDGINRFMDIDDDSIKDMFLSLLPKEQTIGGRSIKIEYKNLKSNRIMLVLTDITKTKTLKSKIKMQEEIQNMIISVASDKNDFLELKDAFEYMIVGLQYYNKASDSAITNILRELHTLKGICAQKEMLNTPAYIHEVEKRIEKATSNEEIISILNRSDLQKTFDKDVEIIDSILGEEFLSGKKSINIELYCLDTLELKLESVINTSANQDKDNLNDILTDVKRLKYESVKNMLMPNVLYVKHLAAKLEKEIYELHIEGDKNIKISNRFKPFLKSFIHLFNNCVDHGIEDVDTRIESDKDEVGTITCNFQIVSDTLVIQVTDDGRGIDTQTLCIKAIEKGIITKEEVLNMSEEDKCKLIFTDSLSTKNKLSSVSGVGVGMSALKDYLERLNGKLSIKNIIGEGVSFTFYLPLHLNKNEYIFNIDKCRHIFDSVSKQMEFYIKDTLKLKINNIKEIEDVLIGNNYAQINFFDGFNGSAIMVLSNEVKEFMDVTLIPKGFSESDQEWMVQELPNEVLNTIVGLSIQNFDESLEEINISTPMHIDNLHLMKIVKKAKNKFVQEIETSIGNLILVVLEGEK